MKVKAKINTQYLENQQQVIQACMVSDSEFGKRLREMIFQELKKARNSIVAGIKFDNGDPRGTAQAVKRYVAGKYLGGVVSILDGKIKGSRNNYEAPRKLRPGQRGGNRMIRSLRTDDILHYGPQDRGFILRIVNSGTNPRYSGGGRVELSKYSKNFFRMQEEGEGYRGSISARNFFSRLGNPALQQAVTNLSKMVDQAFKEIILK